MNEKERMVAEFKSLPNDVERWKWVVKNKDGGIVIVCDNDQTFLSFDHEPDDDSDYITSEFDNYIGWSAGIFDLLKAVGIDAEGV